MLHTALHVGVGSGSRIVLLHGFTQAGGVWNQVAHHLADSGFEVIAPDLPGHGSTDPVHDSADLWSVGRLILEFGGRATYVGYSMGGRALLHATLQDEESLIERMVLVGARDGLEPNAAGRRRDVDEALADRIEDLGRAGRLHEFIDEWLRHPVNDRLSEAEAQWALRLANRPEGMAASLRNCGLGTQEVLSGRMAPVAIPALVMHGEYDLPDASANSDALVASIGESARRVEVPGVGHSLPFEAPGMFASLITRFIKSDDQSTTVGSGT